MLIADGGMETTLIFERGLELPCFASFTLLGTEQGREEIRRYFEPFLAIAREHGVGFVLDTATWRANPDWGAKLGYTPEALAQANRDAVTLAREVRDAHRPSPAPIAISGAIGPRGDGYVAGDRMSTEEAERYHAAQVAVLAAAGVDTVTAYTLTYAGEGIGIVRAARAAEVAVAIGFTVETDGVLPSGQRLRDAIEQVDRETESAATYFLVNCAHPTHFAGALAEGGDWLGRIGGIRANASAKSHAELDEADELDQGDPVELAGLYRELASVLPNLVVVGGCCGTDERHVAEICRALL